MVPQARGDDETLGAPGSGEMPLDFETAQRRLFDATGLDVRSQFIDLGSPPVRTHVFEIGPPEDERPVVFVHGTAAFGAFFAPLVAHLDGIRTIAYDRPGYGLSGPFVYSKATLRATVVEGLAALLDELGLDRVDLVGHSMGGHAAIVFARTYPDRVRRLLLLGSVPAFPGTRPPLPLRLMTVPLLGDALRRRQNPGREGVLDIATVFGERDAIQAYPAFIDAIAAHERDPKAAAAGRSEFAALFSALGWHSSVRIREAELRSLEQPTTVVWGDEDTLAGPADVRDGVAAIPNVRFERVAAGHIPYLAHPERCARLVREMRADAARE